MSDPRRLGSIAEAAIAQGDIASAAIFLIPSDGGALELAAAAGIEDQALDRLQEAVKDEGHPIARTATEGYPTFDVTPIAPGGPALRSHLPLVSSASRNSEVVGVLAVAHEAILTDSERDKLLDLADEAAQAAN